MEARKIQSEAEARSCLAAVEASGRSRVAWAKAHGIDARSLNAWHINLGRRSRPKANPRRTTPPLRLVELLATNPGVPTPYRVRCGAFEVDVVGEIDEERLARVLRTMASSC